MKVDEAARPGCLHPLLSLLRGQRSLGQQSGGVPYGGIADHRSPGLQYPLPAPQLHPCGSTVFYYDGLHVGVQEDFAFASFGHSFTGTKSVDQKELRRPNRRAVKRTSDECIHDGAAASDRVVQLRAFLMEIAHGVCHRRCDGPVRWQPGESERKELKPVLQKLVLDHSGRDGFEAAFHFAGNAGSSHQLSKVRPKGKNNSFMKKIFCSSKARLEFLIIIDLDRFAELAEGQLQRAALLVPAIRSVSSIHPMHLHLRIISEWAQSYFHQQ